MIMEKTSSYLKMCMKLALPVMALQAGQMFVVLADNLMVGGLGAKHLAAASFANNIFLIGMVFNIGLINALTLLAGKEIGGGNRANAVGWLKQSIYIYPAISIIQTLIMGLVALAMPFMGQPHEVTTLAIPYYLILVCSLLPMQFFFIFKQYSDALGNTRISTGISLIANIINVSLNYMLIYGHWGFPAFGLLGAGYATLIARTFMPLVFLIIFLKFDFYKPDRQLWKTTRFSLKSSIKLLKLGFPISGQFVVEVFAFSVGGLMMGWFGAQALAAHQIVISLANLTFLVSGGIATATTIKVSHFRGSHNFEAIKGFVFTSTKLVTILMALSALFFVLFRYKIPSIFINDSEVIAIAGGLMLIAGLFQIFDGLQVIILGALHGLEDVRKPMMIVTLTYLGVMLPTGYFAAFNLNMGPQGIWIGYLIGLSLVGIVLFKRYRWKTKKGMREM